MPLTVRAVQAYALGRPVAASTIRSITAYALVDPTPVVPGPPAPTDYHADQIDILYDLIEKSNPGFKAQYPKGSVVFATPADVPTVANDPYKTDTSVLISPAPGSGTLGRQTVRYRRINIATALRSMVLTLNDYVASGNLPAATWKASFTKKYGLSIPAADISNTAALTSGTLTNVNIAAASLCYKGTVQLTWTVGVRPFNVLITDANRALVGRLYPGGNDFTTPGRKPQGEFLVFCQDASVISAALETVPASSTPASTASFVQTLVDWLNASTQRTDWNTGTATVSGGLTGIQWFKYTLPNAAVPEANSTKYNRCIVIQGTGSSWFSGKIIIHYNV